jgi:hypothetical protein
MYVSLLMRLSIRLSYVIDVCRKGRLQVGAIERKAQVRYIVYGDWDYRRRSGRKWELELQTGI